MNLATQMIADLNGQTITVTRYGTGSRDKWEYVPGTTTTFTATASMQPVRDSELIVLPEKDRNRRVIKGYCDVELLTVRTSVNSKADEITWDGDVFEVFESQKWVDVDLSFWKVLLVRKNPES